MKPKAYPKQVLLKSAFDYNNGYLIRKRDLKLMASISKLETVPNKYTSIMFEDESYQAHRLVWIWHNGDIDSNLEIDHINRIKFDNTIGNLRIVTHQENMFNTKYDGCQQNWVSKKWHASIVVNGSAVNLGTHETKGKATQIYNQAKAEVLDTLRHYRETGKILETELLKATVLERILIKYNIIVSLKSKVVFRVENIQFAKMQELFNENLKVGYSVSVMEA